MTKTEALLARIRELEARVAVMRTEADKAAFYAAALATDSDADTITVEIPT